MSGPASSLGDMAAMQATAPNLQKNASASANIGKTAEDFEGMFMSQMLKPMFDTVDVDPNFGGGHGEETMRSFLVQEYGKLIAKNTHFGIADAVKGEMIKMQSAKEAANSQNIKNGAASYANVP